MCLIVLESLHCMQLAAKRLRRLVKKQKEGEEKIVSLVKLAKHPLQHALYSKHTCTCTLVSASL